MGLDFIDSSEILKDLKTNYLGKNIYYFKTINSTNDKAKSLADQGEGEGTLVIAEAQSRGKGRLNSKWFSPPGGIWASLILRPPLKLSQVSLITLIIGIAIVEAVKEIVKIEATLKWPNDCLVNDKKFSGILLEAKEAENITRYLIAGFGINVNISQGSFPLSLQGKVTSLKEEKGEEISKVSLIKLILEKIEDLYEMFKKGDLKEIKRRWRLNSKTIGRKVLTREGDKLIKGRVLDINEEGALVLIQNNGQIITLYSGRLEYL
ncbi:MAG: biotin--[acetyl-CoA-carboxylase] ligase [bacterium]